MTWLSRFTVSLGDIGQRTDSYYGFSEYRWSHDGTLLPTIRGFRLYSCGCPGYWTDLLESLPA